MCSVFIFVKYIYLPNDKILDENKLKSICGRQITFFFEMMISIFDRIENTVGEGENAGYQHFLLFPQCFSKPSLGLL